MVNNKTNSLSKDKELFDKSKPFTTRTLGTVLYHLKTAKTTKAKTAPRKRNRKRKIMYYNL